LAADLAKLADPGWADKAEGGWALLLDHLRAFDANKDGHVNEPEMRAFLEAVRAGLGRVVTLCRRASTLHQIC
jgi:hypothetical protein